MLSFINQSQFNSLEEYPAADILKQDITMDILKIIQLSDTKTYTEGYNMLTQLMDPPTKPYIDVAHEIFKMYKIVDTNEKLTQIGYDITKFSSVPINRTLFLIYSFQMHCAREASIIISNDRCLEW